MLNNPLQKKVEILLRKIKDLRIQKGITQYDMSDRLNISQNSYFKLEKGITKLDIHRLLKISIILEHNFSEDIWLNFDTEHL